MKRFLNFTCSSDSISDTENDGSESETGSESSNKPEFESGDASKCICTSILSNINPSEPTCKEAHDDSSDLEEEITGCSMTGMQLEVLSGDLGKVVK